MLFILPPYDLGVCLYPKVTNVGKALEKGSGDYGLVLCKKMGEQITSRLCKFLFNREQTLKSLDRGSKMVLYFHYALAIMVNLFWLLTINPAVALAEDEKMLITAGPSWDHFTNQDGHGLYHDIIKQVFSGYKVKHLYVPSVQASSMVAIGRADIMMCDTEVVEPLVLARHPMYENDFFAVYLQAKAAVWKGDLSLNEKRIVWREGYYSQSDFPVPVNFKEVRSGESALKMIILDRADFYIDDLNLINQSFESIGKQLNQKEFGIEKVGTRKYFPAFANTPRGEYLRKQYETGMERLYKEGVLQQIYEHWGFRMPEFNLYISSK